jgi:predicted AAA+ superfamily ATPase
MHSHKVEPSPKRWWCDRGTSGSLESPDVPMFAPRMPAETIGRLWTMLAHSQATPLNQSKLASSLEVSTPAVTRYIDLLVDLDYFGPDCLYL